MKLKDDKIIDKLKKIAEKETQLELEKRVLREKARKQATKKFIQIGSIAARFELDQLDNLTLAGAFAEIQEMSKNESIKEEWRRKGEASTKTSLCPLLISFGKEPSTDMIDILKNMRFKWNKFHKEWQGYGIKDEIEKLVHEFNGKVKAVSE